MKFTEHLEKLSYYIAAYEAGSFKGATQTILVSQPQITRTIKQLENLLNAQLFIRTPTGVIPTHKGELLYKFSKETFKRAEDFEFKLRSNSSTYTGEIRIGTYDSIARYFFPDFIKYMQSLMPDLKVVLTSGRSQEMLKKLNSGQLDLAVHVGEIKDKSLLFTEVYQDFFQFYTAKGIEKVFLKNLISFDSSVNNIKKIKKTTHFDSYYSCENLETVTNLTLSGIGVGLIPSRVAREHLLTGKLELLDLKNDMEISKHSIYIVKKKNMTKKLAVIYKELTHFLELWSKH